MDVVDRDQLRARYAEHYGEWDPQLDGLLRLDPGFLRAHLDMVAQPWRTEVLDARVKHLVCLAVNVATTHLHVPGVRAHVRGALAAGASPQEIVEVFQLVTVLGMHSCNVGIPVLFEELGSEGERLMAAPLTPEQEAAKERYVSERGNWGAHWERLVRVSPAFLDAYREFSMVPWRHGPLEPRVKELVYIAVNVSTTHLYTQGLRVHVANALTQGASPEEVVAVYELVTGLGMHSMAVGMPVLMDALAAREEDILDSR